MDEALAEAVRARARYRCEYCLFPEDLFLLPFQIDHILARQHGGPTVLSNLANSCLNCNSHKGPNLAGLDPKTKKLTALFHPRRHKWSRHFRWDGPYLIGTTPIGRTTVMVLAMNDERVVEVRQELIDEGRLPPLEG
jgi:hypothetical protein